MELRTQRLVHELASYYAPPPDIKPSEWMEENFILNESAFATGKWRSETVPYQKEIIDAFADPNVHEIDIMTSSQWGKNIIISAMEGYIIDIAPGPIMHIGTTIDEMEKYSKNRLSRFIYDTKCLREKVYEAKSRDSNNTILLKLFAGGSLELIGSNSPRAAASKPIQYLFMDEVDGFETTSEGDISEIADRRLGTYKRIKKSKRVRISSPKNKDDSTIETGYNAGTQEKWCMCCPGCLTYHFIHLHSIKFEHSKDEKGNYQVWDVTAQCPVCNEKFSETEWKEIPGKWIADNPDAYNFGRRSFRSNAFASSQTYTWQSIISEWLTVKGDPAKYQVFKNTVLGESWEQKGEIDDCEFLLKRRETYETELPEGVLILTAGVDTQDDRFEYEIVGWGRGEQSWGIEYGVIMGDPNTKQPWIDLFNKMDQARKLKNGLKLMVACMCQDSQGHRTEAVYTNLKPKEPRRFYPVRGMGGPGLTMIHRYTRSKKENAIVFTLGVDGGKSKILGRLKTSDVGDGFCHFPLEESRGYDRGYFQGLINERLKKVIVKGQVSMQWVKVNPSQPNEPLDCRNYAQAALDLLNPNWDALENRLKVAADGPKVAQNTGQSGVKQRYGVVSKGVE
jgi:phage terminase large subunit GpA-like protein